MYSFWDYQSAAVNLSILLELFPVHECLNTCVTTEVGRPGAKAQGQSHAIPWRPRSEPSLAGADHPSPPGQRCEANHQY
jgi:hypothetical protein